MTRSSNGFGQNAISYSEIEAWSRLTHTVLDHLEVRAITLLDSAYLTHQSEQSARRSKK
jgi:hypothetical protein